MLGIARRIVAWGLSDPGATAVEYAIVVAFIAVVIVGAVITLGNVTQVPFRDATAGL